MMNAETWYFDQKFNGLKALGIVVPVELIGIVGAIMFWRDTKMYPLIIVYWLFSSLAIIGNRID